MLLIVSCQKNKTLYNYYCILILQIIASKRNLSFSQQTITPNSIGQEFMSLHFISINLLKFSFQYTQSTFALLNPIYIFKTNLNLSRKSWQNLYVISPGYLIQSQTKEQKYLSSYRWQLQKFTFQMCHTFSKILIQASCSQSAAKGFIIYA